MLLGKKVGLGPGNIVFDADAAPPQGAEPPIFGPCLLWPNGWMYQDATWYKCRPRPHIVLHGDPGSSRKGTARQFSAHAYCG